MSSIGGANPKAKTELWVGPTDGRRRSECIWSSVCLPSLKTVLQILRVVVREDFSEDMADQLIHDILSITEDLSKDSTSAHLAHIGAKSQNTSAGGAAGASSSSSKHPSHSKLSKNISKPDAGRGHKHGGYAKQC
jgi:hypothetical protein